MDHVFAATAGPSRRARLGPTLLALLGPLVFASSAAGEAESAAGWDWSARDVRFDPPRLTIGVRGGWAFNRSQGEIYEFLEENLILDDSDFDGFTFAFDVGVRTTEWLDIVAGFEVTSTSTDSEFRKFVDNFGNPIEQETDLTRIPLTLSLKLFPLGRGRQIGSYAWIRSRVTPYVGGGVGGTYYKLRQKGDFVDFTDLSIFAAKLESQGWDFSQHVFVGLDFRITVNFGLVFEGRYHWADAGAGGDYQGFNDIDLDGARAMVGLSWRL